MAWISSEVQNLLLQTDVFAFGITTQELGKRLQKCISEGYRYWVSTDLSAYDSSVFSGVQEVTQDWLWDLIAP